jgi:RNA polymerase sigma-70 factor, ECF subfamily
MLARTITATRTKPHGARSNVAVRKSLDRGRITLLGARQRRRCEAHLVDENARGGLVTAVAYRTQANGDEAVVARLFEEHSERLLGFCLRQLRSRPEAEDAVQTTFVYALRALRRGVVPENEAAWLTSIAKNVCHWQRRTLARRGTLSTDLDLDTIALARPDGDEEGVLLGLKDALASIPERQRQALVLREWQGLAPREIASELGMSGPATHALLNRARRSLANALTLPTRPVAGIAWLVFELRSYLKALFTGASAKAAVAGVAIVSVGVGGVAVERTLAGPSSPAAPAPVVDSARAQSPATAATIPVVAGKTSRPLATHGERGERRERSRARAATTTHDRGETTRVVVPTAPTRSDTPASEPRTRDEQPPAPAEPDAPRELPVKPPPLPKAELPPVELPPIVVPPIDPPPIDLGPLLPPIDLPPVELPPVELPPLLP